MRSVPTRLKGISLAGAGCLCLLFLQACITDGGPGATPEVPYVINFDFQKPIIATTAEADTYLAALEKYTDPSVSKIKVNGHVVWPPVSQIKTDRVSSSGRKEFGAAFVSRPPKTQLPTRMYVSKPSSTQVIGFKSESDMQGFLKAVSR